MRAVSCFSWLSAFCWVMLAMILVVQLQLKAVLFAPAAAFGSPIIKNVQLMRTDFGLIRLAVQITVMIFVVLRMVDRVCLYRFFRGPGIAASRRSWDWRG